MYIIKVCSLKLVTSTATLAVDVGIIILDTVSRNVYSRGPVLITVWFCYVPAYFISLQEQLLQITPCNAKVTGEGAPELIVMQPALAHLNSSIATGQHNIVEAIVVKEYVCQRRNIQEVSGYQTADVVRGNVNVA